MYVGRDFDTVQDNSAQVFGFDLAPTLTSGETVNAATTGVILENGVDDSPTAHLVQGSQLSGTQITQMLRWGDPLGELTGNTYAFFAQARTSTGQIIIPWARITVDRSYGRATFPGSGVVTGSQVSVIRTPSPAFVLPTDGGYAWRDFPEIDQGEQRFFGFEFSPLLSPGEILVSGDAALTVIDGKDPAVDLNPMAYFIGTPQFSGSAAQQLISIPPITPISRPPMVPDLRGVVYALSLYVKTSFGQNIGTWSRLRVRAFYG
jgi:hypothetical protein